jgi:hypothetical protein
LLPTPTERLSRASALPQRLTQGARQAPRSLWRQLSVPPPVRRPSCPLARTKVVELPPVRFFAPPARDDAADGMLSGFHTERPPPSAFLRPLRDSCSTAVALFHATGTHGVSALQGVPLLPGSGGLVTHRFPSRRFTCSLSEDRCPGRALRGLCSAGVRARGPACCSRSGVDTLLGFSVACRRIPHVSMVSAPGRPRLALLLQHRSAGPATPFAATVLPSLRAGSPPEYCASSPVDVPRGLSTALRLARLSWSFRSPGREVPSTLSFRGPSRSRPWQALPPTPLRVVILPWGLRSRGVRDPVAP